jgi:hypothetical protein
MAEKSHSPGSIAAKFVERAQNAHPGSQAEGGETSTTDAKEGEDGY